MRTNKQAALIARKWMGILALALVGMAILVWVSILTKGWAAVVALIGIVFGLFYSGAKDGFLN